MEAILEELVEVIKLSNQKTLWEYLIVLIPIIISIVAIVISIKTAKEQNKISLFEKRYEAISLLAFIISVVDAVLIHEDVDKKIPLQGGVRTYSSIFNTLEAINEDHFSPFYANILLRLGMIDSLFDGVNMEPVMEFLRVFNNYVSNVQYGKTSDNELQELIKKKIALEKSNVIKKMEKCIKL